MCNSTVAGSFFSHPESAHSRTNLTIHKSDDEGKSWPSSVLVWQKGSGSGYSSMVATSKGLAIAFNQWPSDDSKSSEDGPGQRIVFTIVPYDTFKSGADNAKATGSL